MIGERDDRAAEHVRRGPDSIPLQHYTTVLRRSAILLVVLTLLGGAAGVALVLLAPRTYVATVSVLAPGEPLHSGASGDSQITDADPEDSTLDTEAQFVYSDEVLSRLASFPGFQHPRDELRRRISITAPPNTRILQIRLSAGTPEHARDGADVISEAYLNLRQQVLGGVQQRNREALQRKANLLDKQLQALATDGSTTLTRITARTRRQVLQQQAKEVQKELNALEARAVQPGEILHSSGTLARLDDTGDDVTVANGAGSGLLVGLAIALIRQRRPRPIRKMTDIPPHIRAPVLVDARPGAGGRHDACRRLRNIVFDEEAKMILVCGRPGETAEAVAHGLAALCVDGGVKVTLLRVQRHPTAEDADGPAGDAADLGYRLFTTHSDDGDRGLAVALRKARQGTDMLIVTGPAPDGADAAGVAAACDLTFVVVERGRSLDHELERGVHALESAACPPRGLVMVASDER